MYCEECGSQVADGTKFCRECGHRMAGVTGGAPADRPRGVSTVIVPPPVTPPGAAGRVPPTFPGAFAPPATTSEEPGRKKGAAAFFSSPAGIALIVVVGLLVVAGAVVGIVFAVGGGGNSKVDAATMDVWAEYEVLLEDNGDALAQINMDPKALTAQQQDLKKAQDRVQALNKVLAKTGGTDVWRANPRGTPANTQDLKAAQLNVALEAYKEYVRKLEEFYGALIAAVAGNQLINAQVVNNLNAILAVVQDRAADVKKLTGKFIEGNDQVAAGDFDPAVLGVATKLASSVEQGVASAQAAEAQRLEAERVAAEQAAAAAAQQQAAAAAAQAAQYVTCPNCGGVGTVEGGDGRYVCGFCNGTGSVTRSKASNYNPADWRDY